jgi:hypothetical protein
VRKFKTGRLTIANFTKMGPYGSSPRPTLRKPQTGSTLSPASRACAPAKRASVGALVRVTASAYLCWMVVVGRNRKSLHFQPNTANTPKAGLNFRMAGLDCISAFDPYQTNASRRRLTKGSTVPIKLKRFAAVALYELGSSLADCNDDAGADTQRRRSPYHVLLFMRRHGLRLLNAPHRTKSKRLSPARMPLTLPLYKIFSTAFIRYLRRGSSRNTKLVMQRVNRKYFLGVLKCFALDRTMCPGGKQPRIIFEREGNLKTV